MDELVDLTRTLVSVPSHEDPTEVGDRIERWLQRETDASVTRDDVGNVIARRGADDPTDPVDGGDGPDLALVGHHDVVPPDDGQVDSDGPVVRREGDRLYGRGTADMKGAVAAAMLAFRDATLVDPDGSGAPPELAFASFVGEETGGTGARFAIDRGFVPDAAVVGEGSTGYSSPGVTDVAIAHKGRRASRIVVRGESSHASVPEEGTNAIYRACEVVERLRRLAVPGAEVADEHLDGSLVVTQVDGGMAWNVVPDRCELVVDERTVPDGRVAIDEVVDADDEWIVDQDLPPMRCSDPEFAALVHGSARSVQSDGADPQQVAKPHATDAGWLAGAGTACVICGPAEPGEAHTADESVSLEVLDRCRAIYRDVAERFPP